MVPLTMAPLVPLAMAPLVMDMDGENNQMLCSVFIVVVVLTVPFKLSKISG
jgi:hypothetical protein